MKIKNLFDKLFRRNYSISSVSVANSSQPFYSTFTIEAAVKDGYSSSVWVYRAVQMIAKTAAAINWFVVNSEGEKVENHPLNLLLSKPNPYISKNDLFELLISWLQLSGNAYLLKSRVGKKTKELWAISPDRIAPIASKNISEWILGYSLDGKNAIKFQPEEIIHFKYMNPSNPLIGISPLEVAAKLVDLDTSQIDFNVATMQKRGVVDHVYTFEREFLNQDEADLIAKKIEEKQKGKRNFVVLGSNAKYQKIAATPAELDFTNSRNQTRDEILAVFGVDPKLVGAKEASTYNNLETSRALLWNLTIMPLLEDLRDALTIGFQNELSENETIVFDASQIPAAQEQILSKAQSAKIFYEIGVPVNQINSIFGLNIEEYQNWDLSFNGKEPQQPAQTRQKKEVFNDKNIFEVRENAIEKEIIEREKIAIDEIYPKINRLLNEQLNIVKKNIGFDVKFDNLIKENFSDWLLTYDGSYRKVSLLFANAVKRDLIQSIDDYLESEKVVLTECSLINQTTVETLMDLVKETLATGGTIADLQEKIYIAGLFDSQRALMLARTLTGTAASMGSWLGAKENKATHKRWNSAIKNVRKEHKERHLELVKIDERFTPKFGMATGPRFPLDNILVPADRVNCRCALTYERL